MNQWVLVSVLMVAALLLGAFDHALMVFQIRERIGFNPLISVVIGSIAGLLTHVLISVVVVWVMMRNK